MLFSPLEQTHSDLVVCDSGRVAVAFQDRSRRQSCLQHFGKQWCTYNTAWLLHGSYHAKLLLSRRTFCVHPFNHAQIYNVTSFQATYVGCMCWCNLPPVLLAEWLIFLRATAITRVWNGYRNESQHRKLTPEKKILPPLVPGLKPATFRSRVQRSTAELSPLSVTK